ncbi:hypothetical protein GYMLUDRAFT_248783 [Collybiopsis luxurians FD-317 M1]|uniref:Uncharacterized protein n=1 Tax=Collybiopsis luxurians FD-317 M1 TaxID=944289 RepID=A0A0D0BKU3_9AGAR|nr:hypothetical protein GYMLUDRAFT_248783 [Collybiopsis luxurians FD-317 M1]
MVSVSFTASSLAARGAFDPRLVQSVLSHEFVWKVSLSNNRLLTWNALLTISQFHSAHTVPLTFCLCDCHSGLDVVLGMDFSAACVCMNANHLLQNVDVCSIWKEVEVPAYSPSSSLLPAHSASMLSPTTPGFCPTAGSNRPFVCDAAPFQGIFDAPAASCSGLSVSQMSTSLDIPPATGLVPVPAPISSSHKSNTGSASIICESNSIAYSEIAASSSHLPLVTSKGPSSSLAVENAFRGPLLNGVWCSVFTNDRDKLISYDVLHGLDTLFVTDVSSLCHLLIHHILSGDCFQNKLSMSVPAC